VLAHRTGLHFNFRPKTKAVFSLSFGKNAGTVRFFQQKFTLEDAIGSHA
jgi:hypothetical protein